MTAVRQYVNTLFTGQTYTIGEWAIPYFVNGDNSGLDESEQLLADEWYSQATDDWRDADDNLWVFSHMDVVRDSRDEFIMDEISASRMYGPCMKVQLLFRLG